MPEFFQTAMGRRFYEHTVPELVRQLARLNELLERIATNTATAPTGGEAPRDSDADQPLNPRNH
jgi:hypothetical protein